MAKIVPVWFSNKQWDIFKQFLERYDVQASTFLRKLALSQIHRIDEEELENKQKRKTVYE